MQTRDELTPEQLDNLFDNGYTMEDYEKAPPFLRVCMIGKKDKFKMFDNFNIKVRRCGGWILLGVEDDIEIWSNKETIYRGSLN